MGESTCRYVVQCGSFLLAGRLRSWDVLLALIFWSVAKRSCCILYYESYTDIIVRYCTVLFYLLATSVFPSGGRDVFAGIL